MLKVFLGKHGSRVAQTNRQLVLTVDRKETTSSDSGSEQDKEPISDGRGLEDHEVR